MASPTHRPRPFRSAGASEREEAEKVSGGNEPDSGPDAYGGTDARGPSPGAHDTRCAIGENTRSSSASAVTEGNLAPGALLSARISIASKRSGSSCRTSRGRM